MTADDYRKIGYFRFLMTFTDPYGRYRMPESIAEVMPPSASGEYSPNIAAYGNDGIIRFAKDEGTLGQSVYKSIKLNLYIVSPESVNIVAFRASPVSILDLVNPQAMKAYASVEFIDREGLSPLQRYNATAGDDAVLTFVEPDRWFYIKLKAGAPDNELVQQTRGFLLGIDEKHYTPDDTQEIEGRGYLAYDTPLLLDVPAKAARSLQWVNDHRLALQDRYSMADERTQQFAARVAQFLDESQQPDRSKHQQTLLARDALTYGTLNHPVLRESITEAVIGILWYLGLLVPFVFFFEKLVFGFTDIRKQLAAQAIVFLAVFLLLRLLHPAFEMIRSSLMVLLGFVIFLIAGGITVLFFGHLQENLEEIKKRRGIVTAAEVNTLGVIGTAFMLGLNNMHRRRLRTALTCATLVLITFAMICFTSIRSDLVDTAIAVGKAPYQGILVKRELFTPMTDGELFALRSKYEHQFKISPRRMYVGERTWEQQLFNPKLEAVYEPKNSKASKVAFDSMLILGPDEPLQHRIKLLTKTRWFSAAQANQGAEPLAVIIPDTMAQKLGISTSAITDTAPSTSPASDPGIDIRINGKTCRVVGVFDSASLAELKDLDGRPILPFDIEAMMSVRLYPDPANPQDGHALAGDDDPLLSSQRIVLAPRELGIDVTHAKPAKTPRLVSVAISLEGQAYKPARQVVDSYLEQSGRAAFYGLDGIAWMGKRARERSIAGLIELLIPLFIAAITVLNTMRGSVYERKRRSSSTTPSASRHAMCSSCFSRRRLSMPSWARSLGIFSARASAGFSQRSAGPAG